MDWMNLMIFSCMSKYEWLAATPPRSTDWTTTTWRKWMNTRNKLDLEKKKKKKRTLNHVGKELIWDTCGGMNTYWERRSAWGRFHVCHPADLTFKWLIRGGNDNQGKSITNEFFGSWSYTKKLFKYYNYDNNNGLGGNILTYNLKLHDPT